jgi:CDGSH-type Zn-finger protein
LDVEPFGVLCNFLSHDLFHGRKIMAEVTIKALQNGPYEVAGGARLFDYRGKEYQEDQFPPLYLCRCGQSKNKPFCDGTHNGIGFKSEETVG